MAKKDSIAMLEAKIEVLTRAKKKFKEGDYPGICSAIWSLCREGHKNIKGSEQIVNYINKSLGPECCYLNRWVILNRPKFKVSKESMKQYRLQWIDWMISSLKEDLAQKSKTRS